MNPLKIRSSSKQDLEAIVRIYNEAFRSLPSCWPNPITLEWITQRFGAALEGKTGTVFIAEHDGVPIGYVLLTTLKRSQVGVVALISGVGVLPSFQRNGIGSKLVERATDWAKKQNSVLIENDDEIIENPIAVRFFEKLGFEVFHRGACMSKALASAKPILSHENYEIRELRAEDLDQLLKVRREAFIEFGPWYAKPDGEAFKKRMKNRIRRDDVKVFVAIIDNQVIGYVVCNIMETHNTLGDIRNISVLPRHRNRDVGTALMNCAFNFLRMNKVQTVCTVTETAEGFYEKVGFKVDKRFVRIRKQIQ